MQHWFDPDGQVLRALRGISALVWLNLLCALCAMPVVTAGASLTALCAVLMDGTEQTPRHFFRQLRTCFFRSTALWLALLALAGLLAGGRHIFLHSGLLPWRMGELLALPLLALGFVLMMVSVWVLPLTARFDLGVGETFRKALLLSAACLPRTLGMLLSLAVLPWVLFHSLRLLPLFFLFGISLPVYLNVLLSLPVLGRMSGK